MQDPYPATFQRRHHNISLGAVFFCLHVNNNLSNQTDRVTQLYSDMKNIAMDGYCINPDTTTTFLAILNGWDDRKENIPSFVNNAMYILITVWVSPNTDDKLGSERIQAVFGGKNFAFRTFSPNKKVWSKWEENT